MATTVQSSQGAVEASQKKIVLSLSEAIPTLQTRVSGKTTVCNTN
jgi:hypothetical protein